MPCGAKDTLAAVLLDVAERHGFSEAVAIVDRTLRYGRENGAVLPGDALDEWARRLAGVLLEGCECSCGGSE